MVRHAILLFGFAVFAATAAFYSADSAQAQSCTASSAPMPPGGRVSGAWWREYSSWCSRCGGTPYQDSSGGGCRPGPNWGGKGNSSANAGSGTDAARIAGDMFSRLNPQTPSQIGLAAGASVATGVLSAGLAEMFKGPSPEQIRQRQVAEENARRERERLAREAAEAAERKHRALLTELKTAADTPQLSLKIENDSSAVPIDGMRFVGIPGNDELRLKLGDPEHLARGNRVVDCQATREVYQRMNAGLNSQYALLSKYQEQLRDAGKERAAISDEARNLAIKTAYDEAREIAKSASGLRARINAMKLDGVPAEKRAEVIRSLGEWEKLYEQMDKAPDAYLAGVKYGEDLPAIGNNLKNQAFRLNKLLVDSGIWEKGGEELAKYGFGPAGAVTFRAAKLGIDVVYIGGKHILNEQEIAQARATYEQLHSQYKQAEEKVNNARDDLTQFCSEKS